MGEIDGVAELEMWVKRCRRGDARAWNALVDRFQSLVYSIPRRAGLNDADCEDVFQATFLQLYKALDRIESPRTLPKWLSTTASREAYRLKKQRRTDPSVDLSTETLEEIIAQEDASVDAMVEQADEGERLRSGLAELQERCRKLLSMLYMADDPSYEAIAAELEMPMGSIGPTRARCLDKLRSILVRNRFFN